jgi:hypothetical protein
VTSPSPPDFYWKTFDTAPAFLCALSDANGPINLTGATVLFIMKLYGSSGSTKVASAGTVADALNGIVSYQPVTADTNTAADYSAEWEITYSSGKKQTFPDPGYLLVRVTADLNGT